jgi:IS605 OrfB family transposase
MMAGEIKLCTSEFQLKDKKIFLLASFEIKKDKLPLDTSMIAEASLSIDHPVLVKVGKKIYPIGNREEFLYRRLAIQAARQRVQKGTRYCSGGQGRKKKLAALEHFTNKEKNYVSTKLHLYSKRLIEICLKHRAGTLLLVDQLDKEEAAKEDQFLLRNWSYFELKQKIAYKAERAGITVIEE